MRTFHTTMHCPRCGYEHSVETDFERWMRGEDRELDSVRHGLVRFDLDVLLHRYMMLIDGKGQRSLQAMMFVEVKTCGGQLTIAQRDTLSAFNQILRNRRPNLHQPKRGRHAIDSIAPVEVLSQKLNRYVRIWLLGGHLLELSGTTPMNSKILHWDRKAIDFEMLIRLLRFDVDPDSLRPIDWRRRYKSWVEAQQDEPELFSNTGRNEASWNTSKII